MSWLSDILAGLAVALGLIAPPAGQRPVVQGYVEGEYLRIAPPAAGTLRALTVARGQRVAAGTPLFAMDLAVATAERARLAAALAQAQNQLADLTKGKRPEELAVVAAQKAQAEAALQYSEAELKRQETLVARRVASPDKLESARSAFDRDRARLEELTAQLAVSNLPARSDQLRAAQDAVVMAQAALAQQDQRLADLAPCAPAEALVEDTLYNPGEWVPAGSPVVSLLPPGQVKIVAYVPERLVNRLHPGDAVRVRCDSCPPDLGARVAYVSPRAEYTPPVLYSVQNRDKLVFRVEARPDAPAGLNPGLPVDVELAP